MQQPPHMQQQQWGPPRGMPPGPGLGMTHPMNMPPRPFHLTGGMNMGAPRPLTGGAGAGVGVIAGQITSRPPMLNIHPGQTRGGMPMTMTMPGKQYNIMTSSAFALLS